MAPARTTDRASAPRSTHTSTSYLASAMTDTADSLMMMESLPQLEASIRKVLGEVYAVDIASLPSADQVDASGYASLKEDDMPRDELARINKSNFGLAEAYTSIRASNNRVSLLLKELGAELSGSHTGVEGEADVSALREAVERAAMDFRTKIEVLSKPFITDSTQVDAYMARLQGVSADGDGGEGDDDDLQLVSGDMNYTDPLSGTWLENPLVAPCGHLLSSSSVGTVFASSETARCPHAGCNMQIRKSGMRLDKDIKRKVALQRIISEASTK